MKKFLKFFTALAVFLFIFTACGGKGKSGKQEISDNDEVSDRDEDPDSNSEDPAPEKINCKADGSEEFLTYSKHEEAGCRGSGCILRGISRKTEDEKMESDIYKLDGNILWFVHQDKGFVSVDVSDPTNPKILGSLKIKGTVREIYLHNKTAFIITKIYMDDLKDGRDEQFAGRYFSKIIAVDISNPSKLSVSGEINIGGWLSESKRIGDILYFISSGFKYIGHGCDSGDEEGVSTNGSVIVSVNMKDPKNMKIVDKHFVEGAWYAAIRISEKSIYVAETTKDKDSESDTEGSLVTMLDISSGDGKIVKKAEFQTLGTVVDNGNLYEKGDIFYAVTSYQNEETDEMYIIESFDVSDPINIESLSQFVLDWGRDLDVTIFDGDRLYAVFYTHNQVYGLNIFDISDPSNFKELGENITLPNQSQGVAVKGNRLIAIGKRDNIGEVAAYDLSDPQYVKTIKYLTFASNRINYWTEDSRPVFQVSDDFIFVPVTEYNELWQSFYRLYIIGFDSEKGLEIRGFVEDESLLKRGVALKDSVLAISRSSLLSVNFTKNGKPEVISEIVLEKTVPSLENCAGYPCGFLSSELHIYDPESKEAVWRSRALELSAGSIFTMKNSSRAYIYGNSSNKETSYNEILKVIEFSEDGSCKETDFKSKDLFKTMKKMAVSENNIVAYVTTWDEKQLSFFDMNDLGSGIKQLPYHFDFGWISRILVNGSTFWVSWCEEQSVDYSLNQDIFLCYVSPVDVSDPANPKAGEKINIPGMLSGISDNGRYLHTDTFEIQGHGAYDSIHYSYILELNADKTGVCVIKKETVKDYTYENTEKDGISKTTRQHGYSYPKNSGMVFVSDANSTSVKECRYTKETPSSIKVISDKGKKVFDKTFEGEKQWNNVRDGGFLVLTDQNWTYITPEGKEKNGTFSSGTDILNVTGTSQLIGEKVYIPTNGSGIVAIDVE